MGRLRGLRGARLGTVATPVAGSLVYGSNPIARWGGNPPHHITVPTSSSPVATPYPIVGPVWGSNPPGWQSTGGNGQTSGRRHRGNGNGNSGGWSGNQGNQNGGGWSAGNSPYGSQPNSQALAAAQALLQTNPSLLTQSQFNMLQQAGLVSSSLPYSSVSQITPTASASAPTLSSGVNDPNCVAAGCTGGPYPNCTCAAASDTSALDATYAGLPLYMWIGGGLLAYLLVSKRR